MMAGAGQGLRLSLMPCLAYCAIAARSLGEFFTFPTIYDVNLRFLKNALAKRGCQKSGSRNRSGQFAQYRNKALNNKDPESKPGSGAVLSLCEGKIVDEK
jgi:hypothetical protein